MTPPKLRLSDVSERLPGHIRDLAEVIGLPASIRLVESMGGTTIQISTCRTHRGEAHHKLLVAVIGKRYATAIARHWPNQAMYIPRCAEALRAMRNLELSLRFEQETAAGQPSQVVVTQLALDYKLSDRHIWSILKRSGGCLWMLEERTPDLFDSFLPPLPEPSRNAEHMNG
ncbi:MAG TPA: Mor transcription activator family protein [Pseudomonas sp.]|uniref:Mor transcription activator family protein n=1 Tax=Pseudomonas sp. TaxID=306 RepID=UPI002C95C852|nr:Mor transcription activator family protein [Pseudomonas sp.]HWH86336.1 Mor transcription activator family protein [Pseudomonas sp.]